MSSIIMILFPGWKKIPEMMPRHKGRSIRRNGISLCSTASSYRLPKDIQNYFKVREAKYAVNALEALKTVTVI
jgi:hypothetical protein